MSGGPNLDGTRRVLILMQEIEALEKEKNELEKETVRLSQVKEEHATKLNALTKELEAMDVDRPGHFGHYSRLAQFLNAIRVEMNTSLIRDATKEEPPEHPVLVWDTTRWVVANYNQTRSAMKGAGRLPNAEHSAQWLVDNVEGWRDFRWWIDLATVRPPNVVKPEQP